MVHVHRRGFGRAIGGMGLLGIMSAAVGSAGAGKAGPQTLVLSRNDWVPNNPDLPVLHYRGVLAAPGRQDRADALEAMFSRNGWPPQWRNGIYRYHHYHSTAHEVLGLAAGQARVMLGGPGGPVVTVTAGDVVLLPTGTGHCLVEADGDFLVVGAYPPDQRFDICREAPTAAMAQRMAHLPFPAKDPVSGATPPLAARWRKA